MGKIRLISWNVNGIRAVEKKGFLQWFANEKPDVLCLQETKASEDQLSEQIKNIDGYHSYWCLGEKKGYSGTALYCREKPINVCYGFDDRKDFDNEGRIIFAEFKNYFIYNIYFPNGQKDEIRLQYKLDFYAAFLKHWEQTCKKGKPVLVCGDVNTAHKEIDLARPKENRKVSGFLDIERAWLDKFIEAGMVDTLRQFHKEAGLYTWWSVIARASREKNIGWRIDYFYINKEHKEEVLDAGIMPEVMGSDHCPVWVDFKSRGDK